MARNCWVRRRGHAPMAISVLALLLERMSEQPSGDTCRNIQNRLKQVQLAQLLSGETTV